MSNNRLTGLDFTRSLAILGMIFVNFNIVFNSTKNGSNFLISFFQQIEGKAAATFVVLAGVGISLMSNKYENKSDVRKILMRRALVLFIMGLFFLPIWPADIIHFYGIYLFLAGMILSVSSTGLILYSILAPLFFMILNLIISYESGWDFSTLTYTDLWTMPGMLRHLFYNGFHPVFPWISFLLVGMYIGRQNLLNRGVRQKMLLIGLALIITAELISWLVIKNATSSDIVIIFGTQPLPPFPLFILLGTGTALIFIVFSIIITERYGDYRPIKWMIETGQMSLTNYFAHIFIGMGLLEILGYSLGKDYISLSFTLFYSLGYFTSMIAISHFWMQRFSRGPMEMLLRKFS